MAGNKKQFIRRSTLPSVATADDFEERFARQVETRRHHPIDLPIELIDPSPFQIRRTFGNISELAEAMRIHGFTSRLWVREHPTAPGRYQLIFGERRLRAAREARIAVIPCEVTQFADRELVEIGLMENLQREDLDPLEEAHGLQRFMDEFGYSYRDLAERIGKDKGYVENRLRLLRMPEDIQQMVIARPETMSAAREVVRLPTAEARAPLIDGLVQDGLSFKATRAIVDAALTKPEEAPAIVARHVAQQRTTPDRAPGLSDRVARDLQRDWTGMAATVERWEARLGELTPEQRRLLQQQIDQVLTVLERLTEQLRYVSVRTDSIDIMK
ncbi:MAG TPA: ParB/RepB/Spo0J family partition protein [Herpetosiphonaceae bacterium]